MSMHRLLLEFNLSIANLSIHMTVMSLIVFKVSASHVRYKKQANSLTKITALFKKLHTTPYYLKDESHNCKAPLGG